MKKLAFFQKIAILTFCIFLFQCQSEIKKEDLIEKRNEVKEDITNAKENIEEAYALKEKYLEQQKENMISQLEERQLEVEMEIEKLEDMVEDSKSVADTEINSAINKYRTEKAKISQRIEEIRNATDKNWMSVSENFEKEIEKFQNSLETFMVEVEKLEALQSDSIN